MGVGYIIRSCIVLGMQGYHKWYHGIHADKVHFKVKVLSQFFTSFFKIKFNPNTSMTIIDSKKRQIVIIV